MESPETAEALREVAAQLGNIGPKLDDLNKKIGNIEKHSKRNAFLTIVVTILIVIAINLLLHHARG